MFKVLLVDANSSWLAKNKNLADLEQIIPPIGLMYLGTYLKYIFKKNVSIKIVNSIADLKKIEDLYFILKSYCPDAIGVRGLNIYKEEFHKVITMAKKFNNKLAVVGGGPYVTMDLNEASKDRNIDYFVIGEGEITFSKLIGKLMDKRSVSSVRGLAYRGGGGIVRTKARGFIGNLDNLPFPDYSLISIGKYSKFISYGYNKRRQGIIFSSRGCPYDCVYCHNILGKEFRPRSALNVFLEIKKLYDEHKIRDFYFVDDNFNLDYKRSIKIFDLIISSKIKINIYLTNGIRGDIIDKEFIDKMVMAGVIWVNFSIETVSERLQSYIKKFIDINKITENIHYACKKNIMVSCCVMVGFPTESVEEAYKTIRYLKQFKKIVIPMFFSVKYYPNTAIYGLAIENGIEVSKIKDAYKLTYHDIRSSQTPLISKKSFQDIYFEFLREIFLSKERLLNAIEIQKKYLSKREIFDIYSIFFRKKIKNIKNDIMRYAK